MRELIIKTYKKLIDQTQIETLRYLYKTFSLDNRLCGLIGARGTGKTTLLLQYLKTKLDPDTSFYATVDHIYFSQTTLLEFVNSLYDEGIRYFFLDEIHKYSNWSQEVKNIYDSYPDVHLIFSGSSSIDLIKGSYDLSRRGVLKTLHGLSFREFLNFKTGSHLKPYTLHEILTDHFHIARELSTTPLLLKHFKEYLAYGYYPFFLEGTEFYNEKILRIVEKTVYEDISSYYKLKTTNLHLFKKILHFVATTPPGECSLNKLGKNIGLDSKTIGHYLQILTEVKLINSLHINKTGNALVRNPQKIYLSNPSLYHSLSEELGLPFSIGSLREIFFVNAIQNGTGKQLFYSKDIGDFMCGDDYFEIGGRNKDKKQIKQSIDNSFIVQDDILIGEKHIIPLWLFGFLY